MMDIVVANVLAEGAHSCSALGNPHPECAIDGVCDSLNIARVDLQRVGSELRGRSRELAQYQYARIIDLRGAIFLRDEIHAVLDGSDQANVGDPVVRAQLVARQRLEVVVDGDPTEMAERAVDLAHGTLDSQTQSAATENIRSWKR
jgi:ABC-type iron transport system FetAB ATPase subunit